MPGLDVPNLNKYDTVTKTVRHLGQDRALISARRLVDSKWKQMSEAT